MKLKIRSTIYLALALALLVSPLFSKNSQAAAQAVSITPTVLHNNSALQSADPTYVSTNVGNQTGLTTDAWLSYYWNIQLPNEVPCPTASFTGLRIATNTTVAAEGDPDGVTMSLYKGSAPVDYNEPIISGVAANNPGAIGRLNISTPGYESSDLGVAGPLEAVWDISNSTYSPGDIFTLRISHDAEDGTVDEQTTITNVSAIYDDSSCEVDTPAPVVSSTPTSPKTGAVATIMVAASAALAAIALILHTAKRLKAKH